MSHAHEGGQAPDQASSGRQTGVAVPPGRIIPEARKAASHPTSHTRHGDNQAGNGPRQTHPASLTVTRAAEQLVAPPTGRIDLGLFRWSPEQVSKFERFFQDFTRSGSGGTK